MTISESSSTPSGWYPHPEGKPAVMWWDGNAWDVSRQRWFGAVVEPQQTVIVNQRKQVNHALHLILTLLTCGLWLPVWIIVAIAKS